MLQNQRPYQLVYSKTHSRLLAHVVALCAKALGICACEISSHLSKEYISLEDAPAARERLYEIYPPPRSIESIKPLPPCDISTEISVVIPAHNAERFIDACVNSVLSQHTSRNFEVIVVNDGSADDTAKRLKLFAKDERIHVYELKNGGSAAKARNEGLCHAVGRYIMFVDSDDVLPPCTLESLACALESTDSDIAVGGWRYMYEDGSLGLEQRYADATYVGKHALERYELSGVPWGKLYKRELFSEARFPAEYTCFEDTIIHFLVFCAAKRVCSIEDIVYFWRKNPSGLTQSSQGKNKALQSVYIVEHLLELINEPVVCDSFALTLISQLTNFCYVNVAGTDREMQKLVFTLCCEIYSRYAAALDSARLPYAVRLGERALREKRFDLWVKQGSFYPLIR